MQDLIGKTLGQYQIAALIGEGGMGKVYRARDTKLTREVAVKVLPLDIARNPELVKRFMREASAAAGLDHPNIIPVYTMDLQDGLYYIAMRLINGQTLETLLQRQRTLPPERIMRITEQVADALAYAHERGIVHRDIKPANVMLEANDRVTLMDFGIAKAPSPEKLTRVGQVMGTLQYMSPQQFYGETVDARADLYALGVMIYEMATGVTPFTADALLSTPGLHQSPPSPRQHNPQIPPAFEQVIMRCLAFRPEARYQSAPELVAALRTALQLPASPGAPVNAPGMKLVLPDGREYALSSGATLRMGRKEDNEIVLNDDHVSRYHAEVRKTSGGSVLVDLGSANGTFLNGQRLTPQTPVPLTPGNEIRLGQTVGLSVQADTSGPGMTPLFPPPSPPSDHDSDSTADDARPSSSPTVMLAEAVNRLTNVQLFGGLIALLLLSLLCVCVGTPFVRQIEFIWYNMPLVAAIGPGVYIITQRRWMMALAHAAVVFFGGILLWAQVGYYQSGEYGALIVGALLSSLFMVFWVGFLPQVKTWRGQSSWVREVGWLALMAMFAVAILYGIVDLEEVARPGQWIGAAFLGGLGWFVGDAVAQFLRLRRRRA